MDKSDPSGLLATTVSGIPTGAELGTYDGATFTAFTANGDGTYSLTDSDIDLSTSNTLAVQLATNDSSDFDISLSVTEQEAGADPSGAVTETLSVTVNPVSDEATLTFKDSSGADISANVTGDHIVEDQSVPLFNGTLTALTGAADGAAYLSGLEPLIRATVTDTVGTAETITRINVTIDDPDGLLSTALITHYSALYDNISDDATALAKITNLGGGSFSITAEAVGGEAGVFTLPDGLVLVPPTDYNGAITLNVSALSQDGSASSLESTSQSLTFELAPVAERVQRWKQTMYQPVKIPRF